MQKSQAMKKSLHRSEILVVTNRPNVTGKRRESVKIGECGEPHDPILVLLQRRQSRFGDQGSRPRIFSQPFGSGVQDDFCIQR
uniref:Uncharacterized protein n=1 Tax=Candidatus Kentrum sp. FM TaxID=2126340 RepID=A0A450SQX6_9GAMM|nr:MAG: hypothetical protein BECKFM1743C_GA0114222_101183 [Candidatus Kentron sp. FM]VFJ56341.1 MAG: hypothetical protein BECKFM1743A_GA0114220_101663 [Candidatus Kentron sp. FM]VFK11178.1 MAG: hypothetical protein BECKFM1743B_GA0114221_101703 [Candidatus Kentron sp. FM]